MLTLKHSAYLSSVFCLFVLGSFFLFNQPSFAATERLPDLQATTVTRFSRNGGVLTQERTAEVTIINRGTASAGEFGILDEWLDKDGNVLSACGEIIEEGLAPLQTVVHNAFACSTGDSYNTIASDKAVKLRVKVDYGTREEYKNIIVESNENNNTLTKDIPLPDLVVTGVTNFSNNGGVITQERTAEVVIMNRGIGSASSFGVIDEWLDKDGNVLSACGEMIEQGLSPLQTVIHHAFACGGPSADESMNTSNRAVKLRVKVDYGNLDENKNKLAESNERNNTYTKNIPLPDLVALGAVRFSRNGGVLTQERTADVTIMNQGGGSASAFGVIDEWLDKDGNVLSACGEMIEQGLAPVRSITHHAFACGGPVADESMVVSNKAVKLRVKVDYGNLDENKNKLVESNESNNTYTKDIPLPDLRILSITLDRNAQGERIGNVIIMNAGRDATPGNFYIKSDWIDGTGAIINSCTSGAGVEPLRVGGFITAVARSCPGDLANQAVKLRVTVDSAVEVESADIYAESNERNNVMEKNITAPDLKVDGMNFRGSDKHPEVTIINKGIGSTITKARVAYDWYDINGERLGGCYETIPVLKVNKKYTQKNVFCGNNDSYKWATKFKTTVDVGGGTSDAPESQIIESNENNNLLEWPIPGRENLARITPVDVGSLISDAEILLPIIPSVIVPDEVLAPPTITIPENNITIPTPVVETPAVNTGDKYPSFTANISDDGLVTYTIEGTLDYYGTKSGCTGPRYFDPIIVAWGQINTHPVLDSNNNYTTSHKYNVKNSEYTIAVSFINSCFQRTTKNFTVHPKF